MWTDDDMKPAVLQYHLLPIVPSHATTRECFIVPTVYVHTHSCIMLLLLLLFFFINLPINLLTFIAYSFRLITHIFCPLSYHFY